VTSAPEPTWRTESIPVIQIDENQTAQVELDAPALDVSLVLDVVRVAFGILGENEPVGRATVTARWDMEGGGSKSLNIRADDLGRFEVQLDPSEGLELQIADARWPLEEVTFAPEELTPFRVVEIHLEGAAREPASLSIRFDGDRSALTPTVAVDLFLYDMDRMPAEELERTLQTMSMVVGSKGRVWLEPSGPRPKWTEETGLWVASDLPPARYTVHIAPRSTQDGPPCMLLGEVFEVDLSSGERVEHTWQAEVGGVLRVNLSAIGNLRKASLLDADGDEVPLLFVREGPGPGGASSSSVAWKPGLYDVRPALAAGFYDLAVVLEDGSKRKIPVTVVGGRVNDVVVGPDDL